MLLESIDNSMKSGKYMKNEEFNILISLIPFPNFLGFLSTVVEVLPVDLHLIPPIK